MGSPAPGTLVTMGIAGSGVLWQSHEAGTNSHKVAYVVLAHEVGVVIASTNDRGLLECEVLCLFGERRGWTHASRIMQL